ncbi:alkaline phosphatase D family protein [Micrococcus sp. M4NT]|uniref:alkaline phosphatase D family protein n=1 Tax=Micrococcus sp. M4NT TaxID=2957501 RepID=UPI0029BD99FF|nr:alkaline phosphatase D family protein [Micrococcus sp. M4NT]MDX2341010.1 alkaline phosphatase D family protein [Micrococcus sp. M4NT]
MVPVQRAGRAQPGRPHPDGPRRRHALQKSDPDQQAAHQALPWITIVDDHEITNDAWADGAQNHQPGEGDDAARKASTLQAYLEWMPVRLPDQSVPHEGTRCFRRFPFGDLAQLSIADTRQNRSRRACGFLPLGNPVTDAVMEDPARVLTEPARTRWLQDGVRRAAELWHPIGQQIVMTRVLWPGAALGASGATIVNADQWDGYRPAQRDMVDSLCQARADAVVLTGDTHSSRANELVADRGERSTGVEFVCPSVSSDGFFEFSGGTADPVGGVTRTRQLTGALQAMNPHVKHLDGIGHGWVCVDVTPERVQADWHPTPLPTAAVPDPRVVRGIEPVHAFSYVTRRGERTLRAAAGPVGRRADTPR